MVDATQRPKLGPYILIRPLAKMALAARWLGVKQVVPMHWGTFPVLRGTPGALREHLTNTGIDVLELKPGETAG